MFHSTYDIELVYVTIAVDIDLQPPHLPGVIRLMLDAILLVRIC